MYTDEQVFCSVFKDNKLVVNNCAVDKNGGLPRVTYDDLDQVYVQYFAITPVFNFIKAVNTQSMVFMRFNENSPMTITVDLGDDISMIAFVMSDAKMPPDEHEEYKNAKLKSFS